MKKQPHPIIQDLLADLERLRNEARETMITINRLLLKAGCSPRFSEQEISGCAIVPTLVASGQFREDHGITTAVREYLYTRFNVGLREPGATLDEILDALKKGEFPCGGESAEQRNAFREKVRSIVERNSKNFIKLPTGLFGLKRLHPEIHGSRPKSKKEPQAKQRTGAGNAKASSKQRGDGTHPTESRGEVASDQAKSKVAPLENAADQVVGR